MGSTPHYTEIIIETYYAEGESSRHEIRARPIAGQGYPLDMKVECSVKMREKHPPGTKIKLMVSRKQKGDDAPHLYAHYNANYCVVTDDEAKRFLRKTKKR